ncbi:hypothetical protein [Achromobacter pestifer]
MNFSCRMGNRAVTWRPAISTSVAAPRATAGRIVSCNSDAANAPSVSARRPRDGM